MNCPNCGMPVGNSHQSNLWIGPYRSDNSVCTVVSYSRECVEIATLRKRVEELEAIIVRLRGHMDNDMLRVLDLKGVGGAGGEACQSE